MMRQKGGGSTKKNSKFDGSEKFSLCFPRMLTYFYLNITLIKTPNFRPRKKIFVFQVNFSIFFRSVGRKKSFPMKKG